mmetsp:Transcript_56833/g.149712  ORF Transcript_56833/g.149712 Transcript_56833/m.149712 type:complete len:205 (+) Transcript_56833:95-709(+)
MQSMQHRWKAAGLLQVEHDTLYVATSESAFGAGDFHIFAFPQDAEYRPFGEELDPASITTIIKFTSSLTRELKDCSSKKILYVLQQEQNHLENGLFLLGCFLMLTKNLEPELVRTKLGKWNATLCQPDRESWLESNGLGLSMFDCWKGLWRAIIQQWITVPPINGFRWGKIDLREHQHYFNPLNGNLVQVVSNSHTTNSFCTLC